jgi:hypothetical protein
VQENDVLTHKVTSPPIFEPVTVDEVRGHIGIGQDGETSRDLAIASRITSARMWAEEYLRIPIVAQTITAYGHGFFECNESHQDYPALMGASYVSAWGVPLRSPLSAVNTVKYFDGNGILQTLDSAKYLVDSVAARITPAYGLYWPAVRIQSNAVQIEYVAGYADAASVPEPIKEAIKFIVGQWETFQRGIEGGGLPTTIPYAAKQLLDPYIDYRHRF